KVVWAGPDLPAVAAAAAATVAAEAAPAAATAGAGLTGLGLVDVEAAALELLPVEGGDGGLGLLVVGHGDEGEAAGPAGFPVVHHRHLAHLAVVGKQPLEAAFVAVEGHVADVDLHPKLQTSDHRKP